MTVVLAEDDPDIQLVARLALKRAGFTVKVVGNGKEALDTILQQPPDVILLDWMMPELDGPETCRRLKSNPDTANIPVIFLTAKSQEAEIQRGLGLGAAGYVTKPFDALALGQQVKDIVSKSGGVLGAEAWKATSRRQAPVTIRTRAFVGLWLLSILTIVAIGFVLYSLSIGAGMDAERRRIGEILDVHGSLSRVLVEMKHDQHYYALTGLAPVRDRIEQHQRSIADYVSHLAVIIADPEQAERLQQLKSRRRSLDRGLGAVVAAAGHDVVRGVVRDERDRFCANPVPDDCVWGARAAALAGRGRRHDPAPPAVLHHRQQYRVVRSPGGGIRRRVREAERAGSAHRSHRFRAPHRAGGFHGGTTDAAIGRDRRAVQLVRENGARRHGARAGVGAGPQRNA